VLPDRIQQTQWDLNKTSFRISLEQDCGNEQAARTWLHWVASHVGTEAYAAHYTIAGALTTSRSSAPQIVDDRCRTGAAAPSAARPTVATDCKSPYQYACDPPCDRVLSHDRTAKKRGTSWPTPSSSTCYKAHWVCSCVGVGDTSFEFAGVGVCGSRRCVIHLERASRSWMAEVSHRIAVEC
jgi:hypothetical protein